MKILLKKKNGRKFTQRVKSSNKMRYFRDYFREIEINDIYSLNNTATYFFSKCEELINVFSKIGVLLKICTTSWQFNNINYKFSDKELIDIRNRIIKTYIFLSNL